MQRKNKRARAQVVAWLLWSIKKTRPVEASACAQPGGSGSSCCVPAARRVPLMRCSASAGALPERGVGDCPLSPNVGPPLEAIESVSEDVSSALSDRARCSSNVTWWRLWYISNGSLCCERRCAVLVLVLVIVEFAGDEAIGAWELAGRAEAGDCVCDCECGCGCGGSETVFVIRMLRGVGKRGTREVVASGMVAAATIADGPGAGVGVRLAVAIEELLAVAMAVAVAVAVEEVTTGRSHCVRPDVCR